MGGVPANQHSVARLAHLPVRNRRSRFAFITTDSDESAIAAAAIIGLSWRSGLK